MYTRGTELFHHGVKGQQWGVKNGPPYPLSKKEVKSKIKQAKKDYRKNENPYHTFSGETGKNWAQVKEKHKQTVKNDAKANEYKKEMDRYNSLLVTANSLGQNTNSLQRQYDHALDKYNDRKVDIAADFADDYSEALLKDIGVTDINAGKQMLQEYGITNEWGKYK